MDAERRLFPLTRAQLGFWRPRSAWSAFLLVLPASRRFVVLLARNDRKRRGHLGAIKDNVEHLLRRQNPFFAADSASVVALEVAWQDVVGMDYSARLMEDARLVVESRTLAKRVFASAEDACAHYLPGAPFTPPNTPLSDLAPPGAAASTEGHAGEGQSGESSPCASVRGGGGGGDGGSSFTGRISDADSWPVARSEVSDALTAGGSSATRHGSAAAVLRGGARGAAAAAVAGASGANAFRAPPGSAAWGGGDAFTGPSPRGSLSNAAALGPSASAVSALPSVASEYGPAASEFPSRRGSFDSDISAAMPTTPAALAAARALLCDAGFDARGPRGLSRASSYHAAEGSWRSPRLQQGPPSVASSLGAASLRTAVPAAPPIPTVEVSIGDAIADYMGAPAASHQRGAAAGASAALQEEPACAAAAGGGGSLAFRQGEEMANGGPPVAWPGLDGTAGARPGVPPLPPPLLRLSAPQLAPQQAKQQPPSQQHQHHHRHHQQQQQHARAAAQSNASDSGREQPPPLRLRRGQSPLCIDSGLDAAQVLQRSAAGGGAPTGATCSAACGAPPASADQSRARSACPLCNQALVSGPAWGPPPAPRGSPPQTRTPQNTAGGGGTGYQQPRPSPLPPLRLGRSAHEAAAAAAAAGAPPGSRAPTPALIGGGTGGGGALAALQLLQRTPPAREGGDRGSDWGATPGRGTPAPSGAGPGGSAPPSPQRALDAAAANLQDPTAAGGGEAGPAGDPRRDDLAAVAAALSASGGRGATAGSFPCSTLVLHFTDPGLPRILSRVVKGDMRLLKCYESGLPAWAVWLPSYGLFYRPWMRRVTWALFVAVSVVSMALGFYDLYKNVPHFKSLVTTAFRPASVLFEWLELHTQMRLSILATYLLGKSPLLVQALKLARSTAALAGEALKPLWGSLSAAGSALVWAVQPLVAALASVWAVLRQLVAALLWGPMQVGVVVRDAVVPLLAPFTSAAGGVWASFRAGGAAARGIAEAAPGLAASQGSGLLVLSSWARLEALHLQQALVLRAVRSAQAIVRFFVAAATTLNQHRVSLLLQLKQRVRSTQRRAADTRAGAAALALAQPLLEARRRWRAAAVAVAVAATPPTPPGEPAAGPGAPRVGATGALDSPLAPSSAASAALAAAGGGGRFGHGAAAGDTPAGTPPRGAAYEARSEVGSVAGALTPRVLGFDQADDGGEEETSNGGVAPEPSEASVGSPEGPGTFGASPPARMGGLPPPPPRVRLDLLGQQVPASAGSRGGEPLLQPSFSDHPFLTAAGQPWGEQHGPAAAAVAGPPPLRQLSLASLASSGASAPSPGAGGSRPTSLGRLASAARQRVQQVAAAAGSQQQQLPAAPRRRWGSSMSVKSPASAPLSPASTTGAPSRRGSEDNSAWDRAAAGLRSIRWLRGTRSHAD